jgi:hypothetical protein
MNVTHFCHIRLVDRRTGNAAMFGGATVRINGETNGGPVSIQVATCNTGRPAYNEDECIKPDHFCKKVGREQAASKVAKMVPLRYLPAELEIIAAQLARRSKQPIFNMDYSYTMKYFLPKE